MAEEIKLEQIQSAFKALGFDEDDFKKISSEEITDFSPFVEKVKSGIKDEAMADTVWLETITNPIKGQIIGKEKQLKKDVNKAYNLHMTETELTAMPFEQLIKKAKESHASTSTADIETYKETVTRLMEEKEALELSYPAKILAIEDGYKNKLAQKDIREELITIVASETQIQKENIPTFTTALQGYFLQEGLTVKIDDKKNLTLLGSDGVLAKKADGAILRIKEAVKDFSAKLNINVATKGSPIQNGQSATTDNLIEILGKGIQTN